MGVQATTGEPRKKQLASVWKSRRPLPRSVGTSSNASPGRMAVLSEKPDFLAMISWLLFGRVSVISNPIICFARHFLFLCLLCRHHLHPLCHQLPV